MENIEKARHSLSHLMAAVVIKKYPNAKLGIGPTIENGFYYDFGDITISADDLSDIEKGIKKMAKGNMDFIKEEISADEAKELFKDQPFKLELIEDIAQKGERVSIYKTCVNVEGQAKCLFTDLCAGPHIENSKEINVDGFKITKLAGAYWRGSEKNPMLSRIYGLAFSTREELDAHLAMLAEAEKRDHRKIGKDLDLFVFSDVVGKGLPMFTEKGATIKRELERFIVDEEIKRGYKHVCTPDLAKTDLYKKSGHYPYYKDSMYPVMQADDEELILRPMTCPHHFELYLNKPRSYRELPMRIAELAKLYRYEQSGELTGLIRLRGFCLADAHIICKDAEQAGDEISNALDLIDYSANLFGLKMGENYSYRLSLGDRTDDKKYYKDDTAWNEAENILRKVLQKRSCNFIEAQNEAAFYGPKIDVQMKNVRGKEDTAFTVQYDFVMPKRFKLTYTDQDGQEKEAVVVHRSSIGAIERTIAFLIEHYAGALPLWLSPTQVKIVPVSEKFNDYAKSVYDKLIENKVRVEIGDENETLGKKIRAAEMQKIPYLLVVGEKEVEAKTVAVRHRSKDEGVMSVEDFSNKILAEIKEKKN